MIGSYLYVRIDANHLLLGTFHLRSSQIFGLMNDLSLQVTQINNVCIYDTDMSHSGCCQIKRYW